jgi:WD40 repeat protein
VAQGAAAAANMNTEAFISRRASGMSFDFSSRDARIYIAGTEDGPIHKCSTSYSEQYLETYVGHKGPVYNIQWSPFRPGLFVSCSADWTVRLWTEEKDTELLTFQSASEQVEMETLGMFGGTIPVLLCKMLLHRYKAVLR